MLTAGVLALLAARRRLRLRAARPRARLPVPPPDLVATERRLRAVDPGERLLRVDIAVRAAAASLVADLDGAGQIAVVRVGPDGEVELTLTAAASLPAPWTGGRRVLAAPGRGADRAPRRTRPIRRRAVRGPGPDRRRCRGP